MLDDRDVNERLGWQEDLSFEAQQHREVFARMCCNRVESRVSVKMRSDRRLEALQRLQAKSLVPYWHSP